MNLDWTPLHCAANKNSFEVAQLLIDRGAAIDAIQENGWTSLHLTALKDSLSVGKLLIENGADIDAMNKYGHTSRHWVMGSLEELSLNSLIAN